MIKKDVVRIGEATETFYLDLDSDVPTLTSESSYPFIVTFYAQHLLYYGVVPELRVPCFDSPDTVYRWDAAQAVVVPTMVDHYPIPHPDNVRIISRIAATHIYGQQYDADLLDAVVEAVGKRWMTDQLRDKIQHLTREFAGFPGSQGKSALYASIFALYPDVPELFSYLARFNLREAALFRYRCNLHRVLYNSQHLTLRPDMLRISREVLREK